MPKNIFHGVMCAVLILFIYGCGSTSVGVATYTEDKPRVDQGMEGGNAGYLMGTPKVEDRSQYKKTRKMYVLEVSQGAADVPSAAAPSQSYDYSVPSYDEPAARPVSRVPGTLPMESKPSALTTRLVEYKIEKDDTLQKISKKFYDSYSKWPKIYELNKSVIKNPNVLRPGTVIQIPVEE